MAATPPTTLPTTPPTPAPASYLAMISSRASYQRGGYGGYAHVALARITHRPAMVSRRARGVVEIVRDYGLVYCGRGTARSELARLVAGAPDGVIDHTCLPTLVCT